MQGSRWTLTATQMDGYCGSFKFLPDQIQLLNPFLILLLLPLFQKIIYPFINKWFYMTPLRRMSVGMIIACLSFVISGFVQLRIQKNLSPIPDYGSDTTLMVTNGLHGQPITVRSTFWANAEFGPAVNGRDQEEEEECNTASEGFCSFNVNSEYPRTPTFTWLSKGVQKNIELTIDDMVLTINPDSAECDESTASISTTCKRCSGSQKMAISSRANSITNVVYYKNSDGNLDYFQVII